MAEQDAIVAGQDLADPVEEELDAKRNRGSFLIILLPLVLISAGAGSWLAYVQYPAIAEQVYHRFGADAAAAGDAIEFGQFIEFSNIIVNPADSDGRRLLMISLGIETDEERTLQNVLEREIVVRDTVIKTLGKRTIAELTSIDQRNEIKSELRQAVNGIVSEGTISRLYFTQYVLQ